MICSFQSNKFESKKKKKFNLEIILFIIFFLSYIYPLTPNTPVTV